jgi:DNA repair photolyase
MPWPKTTITTDGGETKEAIAPWIVSASRATDIPAFYGQWFMRRLHAGYVRWINPFSGTPMYVSLNNARLFVFWSKNPLPFLPMLKELDKRGLRYYFHVTLNDYEEEGLEKGVPPLAERIDTFKRLAGLIGEKRVIWRFDPLLVTDALSPEHLLERIRRIGGELAGYTERLTVSFITLYAKVAKNLKNAGVTIRTWDDASRAALLHGIGDSARQWNMRAVTCADENDYRRWGIAQGKCIDDALIERLFCRDRRLTEVLKKDGGIKDKGQRPRCRCIVSKDIGAYDTCGHGCVYCYANVSPPHAAENLGRHVIASDSIAP